MRKFFLILLILPLFIKSSIADNTNFDENIMGKKAVIINESNGANKVNSENIIHNNTSINRSNIYINGKTIKDIKEEEKLNKYPKSLRKFIKKYPQFSNLLGVFGCGKEHRKTVKYKSGRYFNLTFNNSEDKNKYMNDYLISFYDSSGNYIDTHPGDRKIVDPGGEWDWTQAIKDANYTVKPHTSIKILETGKTKDGSDYWKWLITVKPTEKKSSNHYDFAIEYITIYDYTNTPNKTKDDKATVACAFYTVEY